MKLMNIENVDKFFDVVNSCTGKVELVGENIRLNLKSNLAKYVALVDIFTAKDEIDELEVIAYNQEDVTRLINFMVNGN